MLPFRSFVAGTPAWLYDLPMKRTLVLACLLALAAVGYGQEPELRPVVAVLDFTVSGVSAGEGGLFADMLTSHLVGTGAFRVIDRSERDEILKEIEFSVADCSDESCQLEVGRLLAASRIVVGSIGTLGDVVLVSLRLLDVETGEALAGISEKYPSLAALAGDGRRLAAAISGGDADGGGARPLTAQSLISSAKAEELSARLERLHRRLRPAQYADWLKRKGFAGYERDAAVEEKLVFLEEYLDQSNTRGHSIELAAAFVFPDTFTYNQGSTVYVNRLGSLFGATLGWNYQFNSLVSAGAWATASFGSATLDRDTTLHQDLPGISVGGGPVVVLGDKVLAAGLMLATGFGTVLGAGEPAIPLRAGLYFKNFYAGYVAWMMIIEARFHHQVEAGYSIFLGRRRTWPPRL